MSNTEKPIEYAGPTGRERPGEHWNARIIREQNEAKTAQSVMADGITEKMIDAGAASLLNGTGAVHEVRITDPKMARWVAEQVLTGALAGRTVIDLPAPTAWRNRMDGDVDIWPVGGWSVTASPDGVGISTSRDGMGGGLGFRDGQASEIGAALIAADRRLAAKQPPEVAGGVL